MIDKKKGDDEKMKNEQIVISRDDWQNFKEHYEVPSFKRRYLRNKRKQEESEK